MLNHRDGRNEKNEEKGEDVMETPRTSTKGRAHRYAAAAVAMMGAGLLLLTVPALATPADVDPTTAPVPELPMIETSKAIVATVRFDDRLETSGETAEIVLGGAPGRVGDPPLLKVEVLDDDGVLIESFNAWHPLWAFVEDAAGDERRIILDAADGVFIAPFDRDAAELRITDIPLDQAVTTVDLEPAIRSFCTDDPTDSDCRVADLSVDDVSASVATPLILVGESGTVEVDVDVANLGPASPIGSAVDVVVSSDTGLVVSPGSASAEVDLEVGAAQVVAEEFSVSCREAGLHEMTVAAGIAPVHPADVDLVDTNNRLEQTVEVDCVLPIDIDVRPAGIGGRNSRGAIPVLVPDGDGFDATTIDPDKTRLGSEDTVLAGDGAKPRNGRIQRRSGGVMIQFAPRSAIGLESGATSLCLSGEAVDPDTATTVRIWGCDEVAAW